ncbi:hypothetical protein IWW37_001789 [Coemansia sp. RSA 2050]|nr:hypothetical protein IWW37_001789 [Coemansia sp. RSA 2050]
MTSNGKKRSAVPDTETTKATTTAPTQTAPAAADSEHRHPCFWGVLHGESLKLVFVSASLQGFLGSERSAALSGQSLFDFIHPEEANRARHDLVDTFISKPFLGSNIRCRLRRFDLENTGFQQFIRRASESHILRIGHAARHVHDALERKLSLPTIPDIAKLRAAGHHGANHSPSALANLQHLPKRLKTILEDSVGALGETDRIHTEEDNTTPISNEDADCSDNGYLIANIALYLVSTHLSIMKLYTVDSYRTQPALSPGGRLAHMGNGGGLATRHAQVYSVKTKALLCAFPEEGYRRIYGRSPVDAAKEGVGICSLWKHCRDKKVERHTTELLNCHSVPASDPIRLETQVRSAETPDVIVDVQSLLFRWGHLLFVCQQMRSDCSPREGVMDMPLSGYNLSTPPIDSSMARGGGLPPEMAVRCDPSSPFYIGAESRAAMRQQGATHSQQTPGSPAAAAAAAAGSANSPDTRPFSQARAPVTVAANLPIRSAVSTLAPPESVPPRRQSSYTLPPVKSFEERRFSHPIQSLVGDHRPPPPLPSIPSHLSPPTSASSTASSSLLLQYHSQQAMAVCGPATPISASGSYPMGAPRSSPLGMISSPGSRLLDMRQRAVVGNSSGSMRSGGPHAFKNGSGDSGLPSSAPGSASASTQPTPNISPMTACIVHHTPVSMSPAPQSSHPGYVQVNLYPPPEASGGSESWRWSHNQMHPQRQLPPLPPANPTQSPHGHPIVHSAGGLNEQYQSPVASAVASPSMAGSLSAPHRGDLEKKTCKSCGTDSSPEWRKGPNGHKTYVVH